jgi:prepilin-type processing-associated H-X9-DG protein/prepilin-type N-terminal cleavage/methylation domain-containing protein
MNTPFHLREPGLPRTGLNESKLQTGPGGFTLLELLAALSILLVLGGLLMITLARSKSSVLNIQCVGHLRQLGLAGLLYWDDHDGRAFRWRGDASNGGHLFWFGWMQSGPEGGRQFDITQGALHPYLGGKGVEICASLKYIRPQFKAKATGAAYGYGYNLSLSAPANQPPINVYSLNRPSGTVFLADAGQVNTFQAPASPEHPKLEEFYYVNATEQTVHFRHGQKANALFCDGHVAAEKPVASSLDRRIPGELIGRLRTEILLIK